ncbi:MAG: TerB family tellurite resistance protein [Tahibacter sp.]
MAAKDSSGKTPGAFGSLLKDFRSAFGEMFGGGKLDPKQETTIEVMFALLGNLAGADSIVTTHEAEFTNQMMDEFQLSTRGRDLAQDAFTRGRKREIDVDHELKRYLSLYRTGSPEVERLYDALLRLAAADGRLRPGEKILLEKITVGLGYPIATLAARLGT